MDNKSWQVGWQVGRSVKTKAESTDLPAHPTEEVALAKHKVGRKEATVLGSFEESAHEQYENDVRSGKVLNEVSKWVGVEQSNEYEKAEGTSWSSLERASKRGLGELDEQGRGLFVDR